MATITLKGEPVQTSGDMPAVGTDAPGFRLVGKDLRDVALHDFAGRKKLLSIFPSIDTPVCAASVKKFNDYARSNADVVLLMISADLPFAQARYCSDQGLDSVKTLSMMRSRSFARDYGVLMESGPLAGLAARAVVVLDEHNKVVYRELVNEISQEPDYDAAVKALG